MLPKDLWKYVIQKYIMISKKQVMDTHWKAMLQIMVFDQTHFRIKVARQISFETAVFIYYQRHPEFMEK